MDKEFFIDLDSIDLSNKNLINKKINSIDDSKLEGNFLASENIQEKTTELENSTINENIEKVSPHKVSIKERVKELEDSRHERMEEEKAFINSKIEIDKNKALEAKVINKARNLNLQSKEKAIEKIEANKLNLNNSLEISHTQIEDSKIHDLNSQKNASDNQSEHKIFEVLEDNEASTQQDYGVLNPLGGNKTENILADTAFESPNNLNLSKKSNKNLQTAKIENQDMNALDNLIYDKDKKSTDNAFVADKQEKNAHDISNSAREKIIKKVEELKINKVEQISNENLAEPLFSNSDSIESKIVDNYRKSSPIDDKNSVENVLVEDKIEAEKNDVFNDKTFIEESNKNYELAMMLIDDRHFSSDSKKEKFDSLAKVLKSINISKNKKVYRYLKVDENTFKEFNNNELHFQKANIVKNPYNSAFFVNVNKIKNDINSIGEKEFNSIIDRIISLIPNLNTSIDNASTYSDDIVFQLTKHCYNLDIISCLILVNTINLLLENIDLNEEDRQAKVHSMLKFYKTANRYKYTKNQAFKMLDDSLLAINNNFQENLLEINFFEENNSMQMWDKYADHHKGFILEYNFYDVFLPCSNCSKLINTTNKLQNVLYPQIYIDDKFDFSYDLSLIVKDLIFTEGKHFNGFLSKVKYSLFKNKEFEDEKAWKLLNAPLISSFECNPEANICTKNIVPSAIYIGSKMDSKYKRLILQASLNKDINIYQSKYDYSSPLYKMKYQLIKKENIK